MSITLKFPPFPEAGIDHYNIYKSDGGEVPVFSKIGETVQSTASLLEYEDATGTSEDVYRIASALVDQMEKVTSPNFSPSELRDTVRVFGQCLDISGMAVPRVTVEFMLSLPKASYHGIVVVTKLARCADAEGNWQVDLIPNAKLLPAGTEYLVQMDRVFGGHVQRVTVPEGAHIGYYPALVIHP